MTTQRNDLERTAREIFGDDSDAIRRWADYWERSPERNRALLKAVRSLALLDFKGKRVLDLGCGSGGLAEILAGHGAHYIGLDYHRHVLRLAATRGITDLVEGSGRQLPFADSSVDYIAAFDVIEHLTGGYSWQVEFLREMRRVLRPLGMVFLTTPNRWYPYEAHSGLYGPQYLPVWLADRYIRWRNPSFLREHRSFAEIQMMTPRQLRRGLLAADLAWLHDLPCGLDRRDYLRLFPFRGGLAYLGAGWYPHAEFWGILVRRENRQVLRLKRPQQWYYVRNQPEAAPPADFKCRLDFDKGGFGHQLGSGWYWHERDQRGFRWTSRQAEAFLQADCELPYLEVKGFTPHGNQLEIQVDNWKVGASRLAAGQAFRLRYLLPFTSTSGRILGVTLRCRQSVKADNPEDERDLGVMVFSLELAA